MRVTENQTDFFICLLCATGAAGLHSAERGRLGVCAGQSLSTGSAVWENTVCAVVMYTPVVSKHSGDCLTSNDVL